MTGSNDNEQDRLLASVLDDIDQGILIYDRNLAVLAYNRRVLEILELPAGQFPVGSSFEGWVRYTSENGGYSEIGSVEEQIEKRMKVIRSFESYETDHIKFDNRILEIRGKPLADGNFVTAYTEITEWKNSERTLLESEARLIRVLDNSPIGVNIVGQDGVRRFANAKILEMNGLEKNDLKKLSISKSYADLDHRDALLKEYREKGVVNDREVEFVRLDGTHYWALLSLREITFEGRKSILAWHYDITERREMEEKLRNKQQQLQMQIMEVRDREQRMEAQASELVEIADELASAQEKMKFLANHDALTGLPSLRLCQDRITQALEAAKREKKLCALMFVDLDGFKSVNDSLGHDAGDAVLKGVAERIKSCIRAVDTVARIGGDEFVVVMSNIELKSEATHVAQRLIETLSEEFPVEGGIARVGASIGIALYPDNATTADELLRLADASMYEIKRKGKNNFGFAK